jgi:uncharacterized membrane protein
MSDETDSRAELPPSVNENIETIADFYDRHEQHMSWPQTVIEKISLFLGSPGYVDAPPFQWLQGIVTLNAFVISTTVLIRQHRMARLAEHHAHLDLQVNLLAEQKSSKIIEMLEELRRDLPNVNDKPDRQADEMAKPADPKAVLSAIEEQQKP